MDNVLITGVSGLLGWNLAQRLRSLFRVYGTYLDHQVSIPSVEGLAFDLTDLFKIERLCNTIRPKVILHTAAYADPDFCETHHKEALTLNTFATRELAKASSHIGCKLIYISTDLVFNGDKESYSEADAPTPISYYGKTKYLGELEVMNNCSNYVTLRLSLLYGRGNGLNRNFFEKLEQKALQGDKVNLFVDQFRTPLFVNDAVTAVERFISDKGLKGLFHLGGPDRLSRFQFGELFCRIFNFPESMLTQSRLENANLPAPRPRDCGLRSNKACNLLKLSLTPVEEALKQLQQISTTN